MDQLLGDAKRLVQRLGSHDNSVDILISETTNLQNKLIAMRQYRDEINKLNDIADHRPRSTLILGSQLENQRIQNLEQENRELSISLAEHQSALELIMNKYREQVLLMMESKSYNVDVSKNSDETIEMVFMKERIAEMARIMWESAAMDDSAQIKEIEFVRRLQVENENLRELLEISGRKLPSNTPAKIDYINPNIESVSPEKGVTLPLENYMRPNAAFIKNEDIQKKVDCSTDDNVVGDLQNYDSEEMFQSFPIHKLKKRIGSKKGCIFGNVTLPFEFEDENNSNVPGKEHIKKLEQLFKDPLPLNEKANPDTVVSDGEANSENYFLPMDPSQNCFRAIISDIKPLDFNIDMNEKLFDHEHHDLQSDKVNPFLTNLKNKSVKWEDSVGAGANEPVKDITKTSLEDIIKPMTENVNSDTYSMPGLSIGNNKSNEASLISEHEEADVGSVQSDVHETTVDNEIKKHFDTFLNVSDANASDGDEQDALHFLDDVLEFESGFDDNDESNSTVIHNDNFINTDNDGHPIIHSCIEIGVLPDMSVDNGNELDALNFLDDVLDNESGSDGDDDDDTMFKYERASNDINDTAMEGVSKDNDSVVNNDIPTSTGNTSTGNTSNVNEQHAKNTATHIVSNPPDLTISNSIKDSTDNIECTVDSNVNYNSTIDLSSELIVSSDVDYMDNMETQVTPESGNDRTVNLDSNGEVSDTDSEVTYTAEDIDQALSDFDSFLDSNDDNDYDDDGNFK